MANQNSMPQHIYCYAEESTVDERTKRTKRRQRRNRYAGPMHWTIAVILTLLLAVTTGLALHASYLVENLREEMAIRGRQTEERMQTLDATLTYASKRQELLLGIRDEILAANPKVSLGNAYEYAQLILDASEKYPTLDPLLFLAIGVVESGFDSRATSPVRARGLYQIWPATGRMLARALGWEYTDEMLYDPETNTQMAALYLDILFSTYHDEQLVLAEYNGGPLNAGYLRAGSRRAAEETKQYVSKVLDVFTRLKGTLESGRPGRLELMHLDRGRAGKQLVGPSVPQLGPDQPNRVSSIEPSIQLHTTSN